MDGTRPPIPTTQQDVTLSSDAWTSSPSLLPEKQTHSAGPNFYALWRPELSDSGGTERDIKPELEANAADVSRNTPKGATALECNPAIKIPGPFVVDGSTLSHENPRAN
jgi:hypothetical protein